ncbi:MAG: hypothetical protein ACXAEF_13945 [Candidatus Thorarchaeota archaeon]
MFEKKVRILAVVLAIQLIFILIPQAQAAEVWSDNFDSNNLDNWTTARPECFTGSNGYLECIYNATVLTDRPRITSDTNFSQTLGTWSFDFRMTSGLMNVRFYEPSLRLVFDSDEIRLEYKRPTDPQIYIYGTWSTSPYAGTWGHVDVTIQEPFVLDVFINNTHRIHYKTTVLAACEIFGFEPNVIGDAIDNVVIYDTVEIECENTTCSLDHYTPSATNTSTTTTGDGTTPPPSQVPLELIVVGAIGVIVIVAVVFMKLKR